MGASKILLRLNLGHITKRTDPEKTPCRDPAYTNQFTFNVSTRVGWGVRCMDYCVVVGGDGGGGFPLSIEPGSSLDRVRACRCQHNTTTDRPDGAGHDAGRDGRRDARRRGLQGTRGTGSAQPTK